MADFPGGTRYTRIHNGASKGDKRDATTTPIR